MIQPGLLGNGARFVHVAPGITAPFMIGRRIPTTVSITSPNRLAFNGIPGAAGAAVSVCKVRATEGAGG